MKSMTIQFRPFLYNRGVSLWDEKGSLEISNVVRAAIVLNL